MIIVRLQWGFYDLPAYVYIYICTIYTDIIYKYYYIYISYIYIYRKINIILFIIIISYIYRNRGRDCPSHTSQFRATSPTIHSKAEGLIRRPHPWPFPNRSHYLSSINWLSDWPTPHLRTSPPTSPSLAHPQVYFPVTCAHILCPLPNKAMISMLNHYLNLPPLPYKAMGHTQSPCMYVCLSVCMHVCM